jgi:hypothetical protein
MTDDIHNVAKKIFVNPTVAAKIVDLVTSTKPKGWSHKSNAPYYNKVYGRELQTLVDQMMVTGQSIVYGYKEFCQGESQCSPQTLYNRVNQSLRYLIECMDTEDHKYGQWYETVKIERARGQGVIIFYAVGLGPQSEGTPKARMVEPKSTQAVWERQMDDWLEDSDNFEPYVKEGLSLSQDEIVDLKIRLNALQNIQCSITTDRVALIRTA